MASDDRSRGWMRSSALAAAVALTSGCEFFGGDDGAEFDDDQSETEGTGDTDEPALEQGFRVFPRFMLQDVSAVVTLEVDGFSPSTCALDPVEGGYVCDATGSANGSPALIRVERDGFELASRLAEVVWFQIVPFEVHLAVAGGPTGTWSPCTPVGSFATCDEVCASVTSSCAVTSCATDQPQWPIATTETFADAECLARIESLADACETPLPVAGPVALRCCCG